MCWDYSDCGGCGHRTYCISVCDCDEDENGEMIDCDHRDCKSFNECRGCGADLCDDCYYENVRKRDDGFHESFCDDNCRVKADNEREEYARKKSSETQQDNANDSE